MRALAVSKAWPTGLPSYGYTSIVSCPATFSHGHETNTLSPLRMGKAETNKQTLIYSNGLTQSIGDYISALSQS